MENNKGGRPRVEPNLLRKNLITISFNDDELELLNSKNLYKRNILKQIILDSLHQNKIIINTSKDPKYILQLSKIGTNLNQIARKANSINQLSKTDIDLLNKAIYIISNNITGDY